MSRAYNIAYLRAVDELKRRHQETKIKQYFPETGPLSRHNYPKHMQFFAAGDEHRQRLMLAANRIGKTETVGLYELVCHLTGDYPHWWTGKRFDRPIKAWVAGDTKQTVREILQDKLLGPPGSWGSGMLPRANLERVTRAGSVADTVETCYVRHASGGLSKCTFKSYDQGRKSFQGTEQDAILLDEEPPMDVYAECLVRTMTNNGIIMLTFTPLLGASEVVLAFLPGGNFVDSINEEGNSKYVVTATWDDAPHLTEQDKKELYESIPPFQRDARSKGVPQLGAGAILPVPESDIVVAPFDIPEDWPRSYGFDVGWNRTAAVWGARDLKNGVDYLYSEHYRAEAEPVVHAESIRARGNWMPGAIDPASRGRSQKDGAQLLNSYREQGLELQPAQNGVEAGLLDVWQALSTGKLKVFGSLTNWLTEYRLYRRDEKGKIVKQKDHLMDATRYWYVTGRDLAITEPDEQPEYRQEAGGWMG